MSYRLKPDDITDFDDVVIKLMGGSIKIKNIKLKCDLAAAKVNLVLRRLNRE